MPAHQVDHAGGPGGHEQVGNVVAHGACGTHAPGTAQRGPAAVGIEFVPEASGTAVTSGWRRVATTASNIQSATAVSAAAMLFLILITVIRSRVPFQQNPMSTAIKALTLNTFAEQLRVLRAIRP